MAGLGGAAPYWFTDSFDAVGNRTARVVRSVAGATTTTYSYAPGTHQVTGATSTGPGGVVSSTFAYDEAGNTTTRDVGDDAVQTLTWDVEGELAQVTAGSATDSYTYTADGDRLVRRQGGSTTVYLPGGMELTATGGTVTATRYYSFNGQVVAVRTGPGATGVSTLVGDHHGTAGLSVANTTRQVSRRYTDPYGAPRGTAPASWAGDHGFLDKPVDDTGLVSVGARYYDPALGRFVSVDPVMDLADPQQWHGYAYANNNPITWSDPTGLAPMIDGAWSAGAARAGKANPIKAQPASAAVSKAVRTQTRRAASVEPPSKAAAKGIRGRTAEDSEDSHGNSTAHSIAESAGDVAIVTGALSGICYLGSLVALPFSPQVSGGLAVGGQIMGWASTGASVVQMVAGAVAGDRDNVAEGALGTILGVVSAATWGPAAKLIFADAPRLARGLEGAQAVMRTTIGWLHGRYDDARETLDPGTISGPWPSE